MKEEEEGKLPKVSNTLRTTVPVSFCDFHVTKNKIVLYSPTGLLYVRRRGPSSGRHHICYASCSFIHLFALWWEFCTRRAHTRNVLGVKWRLVMSAVPGRNGQSTSYQFHPSCTYFTNPYDHSIRILELISYYWISIRSGSNFHHRDNSSCRRSDLWSNK